MKGWMALSMLVGLVVVSAVYLAEVRYKYSCITDSQCYPCTRWMNCVSEEFYLKNTGKCRIGDEENFSRVVCSCSAGNQCGVKEIKPLERSVGEDKDLTQ